MLYAAAAAAAVLLAPSVLARGSPAACGTENLACCNIPKTNPNIGDCEAGLACWEGVCMVCGKGGKPACGGTTCGEGLIITESGFCVPGPPLVPEPEPEPLPEPEPEPLPGPCGEEGQPCCDGTDCTQPRTNCADVEGGTECVGCGEVDDRPCTSPGVQACGAGLESSSGFCRPIQGPPPRTPDDCCSADAPICCNDVCLNLAEAGRAVPACELPADCCLSPEPEPETDPMPEPEPMAKDKKPVKKGDEGSEGNAMDEGKKGKVGGVKGKGYFTIYRGWW